MATRKKAAKKSTSKALTNWEAELAEQAVAAAEAEANTGGGQFFSVKGGLLTWQDAPLPNNEMAVVILDTIFENVFYEGRYDPDVPQSPTCFAFDHDEDAMEPHKIVVEFGQAQSTDGCKGCEHNEWGSADTGKGKACRNTRRLAMIPAGTLNRAGDLELFDDVEHYEKTTMGFMKLPVTSVKGYASFVKQVAGALKRPPHGIITRISVVPDPKTQFKVVFEPLEKASDAIMAAIMQRREEAQAIIDFPYTLEEEQAPPKRSKAAKKPAAKKKPVRRKY